MGSLIVLQDKHHQSQARFPSRDWLSAGFLAAKSATRGWEGLAGTGRAGTGSPLMQKVTPTIKLSPLFPPPLPPLPANAVSHCAGYRSRSPCQAVSQ